mgnify:CR=1 FL=1
MVLVAAPFVSRHLFTVWFGTLMIAAEYGSLVVLRRGRPAADARALTRYWTCAGLPLASFTWFRFDFFAVWFTVLAIVASDHGRAWRRAPPCRKPCAPRA